MSPASAPGHAPYAVSVTRPTSRDRRQRWTFTLAPPREGGLELILKEYAVEVRDGTRWKRPVELFYKRGRWPEAKMPLAEVPRLDDETKAALLVRLCETVKFYSQSDAGLQPL